VLFVEIIALVTLTAMLTRFLRQAPQTVALRDWMRMHSRLLHQLFTCTHCLSFWIAVAGTAAAWYLQARTPLEVGAMVLVGWRGAHYVNRSLDQRRDQLRTRGRSCLVCDAPFEEGISIERGGLAFCSTTCWFDHLRTRPTSRKDLVGRSGEIIRQEIYPLSYKNVTNKEAHDLMEQNTGYVYVDVRSIPEFQNGHPGSSRNIPIFHKEPAGMVPNPDFLTVMEAHFPRDAKLLIGCQSGVRSVRAAEALISAGFQDVTNVKGGYGGVKDPSGQTVEVGWFEQGLPTDYGEPDGRNYAALAGRRQDGNS
jgi:rhodanese-related sulfurtransferase